MVRLHRASLALFFSLFACSAKGEDTGSPTVDSSTDVATSETAAETGVDDGGFTAEAAPMDAPPEKVATVYANTDDTLYEMDPDTKEVKVIGTFTGLATGENMTDVAVDADGRIFGVSDATGGGKVWELTLPSSGTGTVSCKSKRSLPSTTRFYALAFAPKGVLGVGEELVGGDSQGDLYLIRTDGSAPLKLGGFGDVKTSDPGSGVTGDTWQLSGDVAFFSNAGAPVGLATLRPCKGTSCKTDNDVVVEIDMVALATKNPSAYLRKRFIGTSGTGYGRLFGIGAWDANVFAFQRQSATNGAQLISISLASGTGTILKDFPDISSAKNGWSGAGVSTSAKITVPK